MKKIFTTLLLCVLGALTPALAVTWEITYPIGGKASAVEDVQIKCTEVAYRYLAEDATATVTDADGSVVKSLVRDDITLSFRGSYCTVDFEFNPAITTPGAYTISVPEGAFSTTDGAYSEAFEVNFAVESSSYAQTNWDFTCLMPENGVGTVLDYVMLMGNYPVQSVNADAVAQLYNENFEVVAQLDGTNNLFAFDDALMVVFDPAITTPGTYMLVINPEAVVCADAGVTNADEYIMLTVEAAAPEYTITAMPEDNSTISTTDGGIQAIYLAVNGYAYSAANDSGIEMTITKDGNPFATVDASALMAAMDRKSLYIILPEAAWMTEAGQYTVTMPEGFFTMKSAETGEIVQSPEITLNYTITAPETPLSWTIEPAPGTVSQIDTVTITFNKPVKPALTSYVNLFFTNYSYLPETVTEGQLTVSDDGLVATIAFEPVFAEGGIFQVRLFEGSEQLAVVDGETFPGINITYKVDAPLYAVSTPEDGATVESIEQTKVKFPHNNKLAASDQFAASYVCGDKKVAAELVKVGSYDFGDPAYVTVKPESPITEDGVWTLVIEKGSLIISNYDETMESPQVTVSCTVGTPSSITDIQNAAAETETYNMQGIRVKADKTLAPGLYIMGGKKVYIR